MLGQDTFNLYKDIQQRTNGELYLGIVGPVRTGKSTFIRRFMNQMVIPNLDPNEKNITTDELPVSGKGTLITTVEPKFVPQNAVKILIDDNIEMKIRLIDCVGYIAEGATGIFDQEKERMVKTPWFAEDIPFSKAAHIGTDKVIKDHATIGIVITTDGSFGELQRENFITAEEQTIEALKKTGKPYIIILNTSTPHMEKTQILANEMSEKYSTSCVPINCDVIQQNDIHDIMRAILNSFPVNVIKFYLPKWIDIIPNEYDMRKTIIESLQNYMSRVNTIKDIKSNKKLIDNQYIDKCFINEINSANGEISIIIDIKKTYYYKLLSQLLNKEIRGENEFFKELIEMVEQKSKTEIISKAMDAVKENGYGSVMPQREDIIVKDPVIIKHGNKYGVNIKAVAPSIHMINAQIETEIAPIVGTQQQAQDLVDYITKSNISSDKNSIWKTLIFGKTMEELVDEGLKTQINKMTENCQEKMQETLQTIINDSNGNVIFVII